MASLDLQNNIVQSDLNDAHLHNARSGPDQLSSLALQDIEKQDNTGNRSSAKESVYKNLGWLDRLLALWILLAIIIGILLGQYVDGVEYALQRGKFVDVSIPIGMATSK